MEFFSNKKGLNKVDYDQKKRKGMERCKNRAWEWGFQKAIWLYENLEERIFSQRLKSEFCIIMTRIYGILYSPFLFFPPFHLQFYCLFIQSNGWLLKFIVLLFMNKFYLIYLWILYTFMCGMNRHHPIYIPKKKVIM